jgi:hypothetical protein
MLNPAFGHGQAMLSGSFVLHVWLGVLQEARGGEVVVREGLLVQPPTITAQPLDAIVNEGATVQLNVKAVVSLTV